MAKNKSPARPRKAPPALAPTKAIKRGRGHPKFIPTDQQREQVKALVGGGTTQDDICRVIYHPGTLKPISIRTLRKAFRAELDTGMIIANSLIAQSLFQQATGAGGRKPNVAAAIFWAKARMGWIEKQTHELTGPGGIPLPSASPPTLVVNFVRKKVEAEE